MNKKYNIQQLNQVHASLISASPFLKEKWFEYLENNYSGERQERLTYFDMMEISALVICLFQQKKSNELQLFFDHVEEILLDADEEVNNLMLAGLIEGIQQICRNENIDMRCEFDQWLSPVTKKNWDELTAFYKFE